MRPTRSRWSDCLAALIAAVSVVAACQEANALITGGEGNSPVNAPGWPAGADAVFNVDSRIAYWEGPPIGGGQMHSECRGDTAAFNEVLKDFAKIDTESRKLVVHDGIGNSVWLNINNEPELREKAQIDWTFTVWDAEGWNRVKSLPLRFRPEPVGQTEMPAPEINVYVGLNIDWDQVTVPEGIEVDDRRLEAHGFTLADGTVVEGTVVDVATGSPLKATVHLEEIERGDGTYGYSRVSSVESDENGRWVMKSVPAAWYRIVVESPGRAPRIAGFVKHDGSPTWMSMPTSLVGEGAVSGAVYDEVGSPLAGVKVQLDTMFMVDGVRYQSPRRFEQTTTADGKFHFQNVPKSQTTVSISKSGYARPGLAQKVDVPADGIDLTMFKSATVRIVVNFGQQRRPSGYLVKMEPEGGEVVGSYGGSATLPASNTYEFRDVPPGAYTFYGRPNPGSDDEETEHVTANLEGGETTTVTLEPPAAR